MFNKRLFWACGMRVAKFQFSQDLKELFYEIPTFYIGWYILNLFYLVVFYSINIYLHL